MEPQSLDEFLAWKPEPVKALISEGLLYSGTRMLIYGRYKSYKSMVASSLMLNLASGTNWLGFRTNPEGVRVLYLQIELSHQMLQKRILKMAAGHGVPIKKQPFIWTEHFIELDTREGAALLDTVVQHFKPEVVIIDPVYKVLSGNISEGVAVKELLSKLDILLGKYPLAVVLVTHSRKSATNAVDSWGSDDMLGSVLFSAWADTVIKLSRTSIGIRAEFDVVRHAENELEAKEYRFERDTLRFVIENAGIVDAVNEILEKGTGTTDGS